MMQSRITLVVFLLTVTVPAWAVVTDDDTTSEADPSTHFPGLNWDGVFTYDTGSGEGKTFTGVDPYWVITSRHFTVNVGATFSANGTTYTVQEVVNHSASADPNHTSDADLTMLRVDKVLPHYYDLYNGSVATHGPNRTEVVIAGTGHAKGTITDNPTGLDSYTYDEGTTRQRRWGTNKLDVSTTYNSSFGSHDGFRADFILNDTTYEAGTADHDSGGGWFVNDGGTWKLAAMTWAIGGTGDNPPYESSFAVDLRNYDAWIEQSVPEPATVGLLGIGGVFMLIRRKRR
jgi:hypothetical protein